MQSKVFAPAKSSHRLQPPTLHTLLTYLIAMVLPILLIACNLNLSTLDLSGSPGNNQCQSNCSVGPGVYGVQVLVQPEAGEHTITDAIRAAKNSVWLEMYLLTDRNIIRALEDAANRSIDIRVMLEPHPFGGGSPLRTIDELKAAGIKVQEASPAFPLTHEKGMIIDNKTAYIMTSNFTRSALGGSSAVTNREYDIIDTNPQDVQAVTAIFNDDWTRTPAQFTDPNLVVSPINSRNAFTALITSAHSTLLIEAEEMQDSTIAQAIASAAQHGIHVQVILPAPSSPSGDSNNQGISLITQAGVQVREDTHLYMHAKIIIVDGKEAFVGSENISTQSLDQNRELGILISDQAVLNTLQQTFQHDWGDSRSV